MVPLNDHELDEAQAFAVKAVIFGAVALPFWLITLHFAAAALKIDFTVVKEGELILACIAAIALVSNFAFGNKR